MEKALVKTDDIGIHAFQAGIFVWDANILSPVVPPDKPVNYQSLEYTCKNIGDLIHRGVHDWSTYAAVAGIAQYSLVRGKSAGVLGKVNTKFRWATTEEATEDLNHFGDQVIGPPVAEADEKMKRQTRISFFGEPHIYTGPERLVKITVMSRVFPGRIPSDITSLVQEVDEASGDDPMTTSQGYYFFHAEEGRLRHQAFGKSEKFDAETLLAHGRLERTNSRMLWLPHGTTESIDFTAAMYHK